MALRLLSRILVAYLLFLAVFSGSQAGAWYCEGKRCGITPSRCCCDDLGPRHEEKCPGPLPGRPDGSTICPTGCGCVLVMSAAPDLNRDTSPALTPAVSLVALLPAPALLLMVPAPLEVVTFHIEPRGPPREPLRVGSPSLRAPPAA